MTAAEINTQVLYGAHAQVKAFLAPVIAQVQALLVDTRAWVGYDGVGGILVQFEANGSTAANWKETYAAAHKVRKALPESLKVTKPSRGCVDGGTFQIVRDGFHIKVR